MLNWSVMFIVRLLCSPLNTDLQIGRRNNTAKPREALGNSFNIASFI